MSQGWIMIHRKIKDSSIWTDSQAVHLWLTLLINANHAENEFLQNGSLTKVKRGQILTGRKALSAETGINESKIQRLLKTFEKCHMIEQLTNNRSRLISILNYDQYQASEQPVNNQRTTDEQPVNTNNNDNNIKNDNNRNNISSTTRRFTPPELHEVSQYCIERKNKVDAQYFLDFYQSKNWMVGKNKMKDWKACMRTWEKKDRNNVQDPTKTADHGLLINKNAF